MAEVNKDSFTKSLPSNSNGDAQQAEKKRISGSATIRKKTPFDWIDTGISTIINEAPNTWRDIIKPRMGAAIADGLVAIINTIFYGSAGAKNSTYYQQANRINYTTYSSSTPQQKSNTPAINVDVSTILFDSKQSADEALKMIFDSIAQYGQVSVADVYDIAGIAAPFTYTKYGWRDIRYGSTRYAHGGWVLDLPAPQLI